MGSYPNGLHFYPRGLIILTVASYALFTWLFPSDIDACVNAHFLVKVWTCLMKNQANCQR